MGMLPDLPIAGLPLDPSALAPSAMSHGRAVLSLGALVPDPTLGFAPPRLALRNATAAAAAAGAAAFPTVAQPSTSTTGLAAHQLDAMQAHLLESMPKYPAPVVDDAGAVHDSALVPPPEQPPAPPAGPAPGSPELPSTGSAGHADGTCKPCAFMHTKGCNSGPACKFCHLCGPDEHKLRRKRKMQLQREMAAREKEEKEAAAAAGGPSA
eukprot:CAMPEP_0115677526 /NCGR_PEP_ID=MMETSP0272-20121206/55269_1 /TAXON_ID=71861 /ORGANISM="Scrippsiella trochoidea, Strain CCMP3099" /LENGTH=209 /DNA_ID=CAMNT_0003116643 /DNA_START=1 /DNA_END=631 /DNA_ORIENTATION=-